MSSRNACGSLIKQIHDELEQQANNALRPQGLTMAQVGVLLALVDAEEGQQSMKELEQILRVAQSTTAGIVSRLEQKGLVEALGDLSDRRVKLVRLTQAGRECCCGAEEDMSRTEALILSGLTETERDILLVLLEKVRNSLQ